MDFRTYATIVTLIATSPIVGYAQDKPVITGNAGPAIETVRKVIDQPKTEPVKVEQAPDDVQNQYATLEFRQGQILDDVKTLQDKADLLGIEMQRVAAKALKPGFHLDRDPQTRRLILVPNPPEPKK